MCSTTVFSHSQTVVVCGNCQTVLCQPTGGRARLTEGCSFRKKGDWCCYISTLLTKLCARGRLSLDFMEGEKWMLAVMFYYLEVDFWFLILLKLFNVILVHFGSSLIKLDVWCYPLSISSSNLITFCALFTPYYQLSFVYVCYFLSSIYIFPMSIAVMNFSLYRADYCLLNSDYTDGYFLTICF